MDTHVLRFDLSKSLYSLMLLCILFSLTSCAARPSGTSSTKPDGHGFNQLPEQFPGDIPPVENLRANAEAISSRLEGNRATTFSPNASRDGSDLLMESTAEETSFAIFTVDPGQATLVSVEVLLELELGTEAYVGAANLGTGRWDFSGPLAETALLELDDTDYRTSDGLCFIAAVAAGGTILRIDALAFTTEISGWQTAVVDSGGNVGEMCSLAVVDGHPAISYFDRTNQDLKYARSSSPTGASQKDWSNVLTVDSEGLAGLYTSLALVDGNPAICYGGDNYELKYARSSTPTGAAVEDWDAILTIDELNRAGYHTSMAVVAGNPAISCQALEGKRLLYYRSSTATGADAMDWPAGLVIDEDGEVGAYNSLAVVDGSPAISYSGFSELSGPSLFYVRAETADGALLEDWPTPVVIRSGAYNTGRYSSLAVVDGRPAISCYTEDNDTSGTLLYFLSTTTTGSIAADWDELEPYYGIGYNGFQTSLAVISGRPAICYSSGTDLRIKFIRSDSPGGGSAEDWTAPETVDGQATLQSSISLVDLDGRPAVAYYDTLTKSLKFAVLLD